MAGLVPAIPIDRAKLCVVARDRWDRPGDDESGYLRLGMTGAEIRTRLAGSAALMPQTLCWGRMRGLIVSINDDF
jgi:hypothetical protein